MSYDTTSRRQDAAAHNAEIGLVSSRSFSNLSDDEYRKERLALALVNLKHARFTPNAFTKLKKGR